VYKLSLFQRVKTILGIHPNKFQAGSTHVTSTGVKVIRRDASFKMGKEGRKYCFRGKCRGKPYSVLKSGSFMIKGKVQEVSWHYLVPIG
jgi:hypothetical protein